MLHISFRRSILRCTGLALCPGFPSCICLSLRIIFYLRVFCLVSSLALCSVHLFLPSAVAKQIFSFFICLSSALLVFLFILFSTFYLCVCLSLLSAASESNKAGFFRLRYVSFLSLYTPPKTVPYLFGFQCYYSQFGRCLMFDMPVPSMGLLAYFCMHTHARETRQTHAPFPL